MLCNCIRKQLEISCFRRKRAHLSSDNKTEIIAFLHFYHKTRSEHRTNISSYPGCTSAVKAEEKHSSEYYIQYIPKNPMSLGAVIFTADFEFSFSPLLIRGLIAPFLKWQTLLTVMAELLGDCFTNAFYFLRICLELHE